MSITVFLGPSLPPSEAKEFLDADFRPPAAQGDLYNAASEGAKVIALIDGYFEQVPAVWHKEVLWAMKEGIHVYGASSMGALRAAELAPFGMTGIGHVYEAFATCELEDDDEVAVTHGPRELGYPITSEAMVNIRTTFAKAAGEGTISEHTAATLTVLAKRMYYPSRTYAGVIAKGREARLPEAELNALEGWLPTNKVDQKRLDAIALLNHIKASHSGDFPPKQVGYHFEHTDTWEQATRDAGQRSRGGTSNKPLTQLLLDELRLGGQDYNQIMPRAASRALALQEGSRQGISVDQQRFREVLHTFFHQRGLRTPEQIAEWMARQGLDEDGLTTLIRQETIIGHVETFFQNATVQQLPDTLRTLGCFDRYMGRALAKARYLEEMGLENASLDSCGLTEEDLISWYFEQRGGQARPADIDSYCRSLGIHNRYSFIQALAREYLFENRLQ